MDSLPSPAISPENSPKGSPSTPVNLGRKRARSAGSAASSSKRAMSEDPCPSAVEPPQSSTSSPPYIDDETDTIDAYMREQEEDVTQQFTFVAPVPISPPPLQHPPLHSPSEKLQFIRNLKIRKMVPGETWYIVSRSWYRKWEKACTGEVDKKEGAVMESQLGPVDNSSFFKDGKFDASQSMLEGVDVEFVPRAAWNAFVQWYGETPHVMECQVITRGFNNEVTLELRPLILKVFRLLGDTTPTEDRSEKYLTVSSQARVSDLLTKSRELLNLPPHGRCRAWTISGVHLDGSSISRSQFQSHERRLLPSDETSITTTLEEALIQPDDGIVIEIPDNGVWLIDDTTIRSTSTSTVDSTESLAVPFFSSRPAFLSKLGTNSTKRAVQSSSEPMALTALSVATSSTNGKGKPGGKGIIPGTVGFANMGNTCFMNSALQCLAHAQELVDYFLTGVYANELNPDNPLGMQGAIAEAFGVVLNRVWQPQNSVYAPREFKMQLQRFAPQFSGYQQHDSQELVAFLLDGLHEDLNRVLKKPYVEKPDWNGGGDKELISLAKESWEGYKRRNDSVIVDLFQGQYRSTVICPECNKVSITFDPFMYLTLPLPVQKKWAHTILYIPWDVTQPHVKVPVEVNRNANFKDVRQLLGRWLNAAPDNLLTLETFSNRFYKYLDDAVPVSDISDADHVVCFELPCHAQQSRNWMPSFTPTENTLILPVHLCKEIPSSHSSFHRPLSGFSPPFIIALDYEQRRDRRKIYALIVERLERWTRHARDLYQWEEVPAMKRVEIRGSQPKSPITELKGNGDVVTFEEDMPEEGDVTDERQFVLECDSIDSFSDEKVISRVGPKPDLFEMHIQSGHDKLGASNPWGMGRWERWETREQGEGNKALLFPGDALYCEWDGNFRTYFFGDESRFEHALWADSHWGEFIHPEFKEMQEASTARSKKYISLDDCLQEFTRKEQLGEDDPWYCPQCKKHQQATKKFDIWTIPDILVVHLKRFSNNRILRDKIDAFVDFPIEGLDLTAYSGEREVAKRLAQEGQDLKALGLSDLDESLLYDLFAVDEHMGGLGGGHYIAYAKNHENGKWYHFDDTRVSLANASDSVNANAYLLFYKRRTTQPIGGKTLEKVNEAKQKSLKIETEGIEAEVQLPTPPDDEDGLRLNNQGVGISEQSRWLTLDPSSASSRGGDDDEIAPDVESNLGNNLPALEGPRIGPQLEDVGLPVNALGTLIPDALDITGRSYSFPNPESMIASPASSNGADAGDIPDMMDFTNLDDDDSSSQDEPSLKGADVEISVQ